MRTKPDFGNKEWQATTYDSSGCIRIPLIIVVSIPIVFYVVTAIDHVQRGYGSRLDQSICWGTFIILFILTIMGLLNIGQDSKEVVAAKQEWKKGCIAAEATIVSRSHYAGGSYQISEDGDTRYASPRYRLILKLPNQVGVEVDIRESVYKKLENRNTVRIYYKPDAPMTFLLEEEL